MPASEVEAAVRPSRLHVAGAARVVDGAVEQREGIDTGRWHAAPAGGFCTVGVVVLPVLTGGEHWKEDLLRGRALR